MLCPPKWLLFVLVLFLTACPGASQIRKITDDTPDSSPETTDERPPPEETTETTTDLIDLTPGDTIIPDTRDPDIDIPDLHDVDTAPDLCCDALPELDELSETDLPLPVPKAHGEPCYSPEDCLNGVCLDTQWGRFCAPPCDNGCFQGWHCIDSNDDSFCVPMNPPSCERCSLAVCPSTWCQSVGQEGDFCMAPCLSHHHCPPHFLCLPEPALGLSLCHPMIESCYCTWEEVGKLVPCERTNEFGTCQGKGLCTEDAGVIYCNAPVAQIEVCDGLDNNCDDVIDDPWPQKGKLCDGPDEDLCLTGLWICSPDGTSLVCTGEIPQFEICDGKDNDCDGQVDEDFPDSNGDGVADCLD